MNRNTFLSLPSRSFSYFSLVSLLSLSIFVILLSLYSNFLTHCRYHHTISLFSLGEKSLFSPPLSLYISIYHALSSISLSVHITLSFSWPFYLFHFHTAKKNNKINLKVYVSPTISESGSFSDFVILLSFTADKTGP